MMMTKEYVLSQLSLKDEDIYSIYQYGSRVYGTYSENSDWDFIIIANQKEDKLDTVSNQDKTINATIYSINGFTKALNEHEISILECYFLNYRYKLKDDFKIDFKIDLTQLRKSISTITSNSWVKAKKKLLIEEDFNVLTSKKSLFHSLRILYYGIQLATDGSIYDFQKANYLWYDILNTESNWNVLKNKYQELRNKLDSEFKKYAPK